jgi:hypothetical protein
MILTLIITALYIHQVWINRELISGCEFRGDQESTYLERLILLKSKWIRLFIHKFHRSDAEDLHDHPWDFISVILWRGYNEEVFTGETNFGGNIRTKIKRVWPGMVLFRRSTHLHRVILIKEKSAITFVISFKYKRSWGFITDRKYWTPWRKYYKEKGC